jgi:glyoxylase-like metal-dependent hydrolase (beta-lactamase superfamily II)
VPQYTPKLVPHGFTVTSPTHPYTPLNITILHTPGHTPDEIAIYDASEMMLYVGDTLYENAPIIFPNEGSLVTWLDSVDYLMAFVTEKNRIPEGMGGSGSREIMLNAGHETAMRPAKEVLADSKAFLEDVIAGREPVKGRQKGRGEDRLIYEQQGGRFSLWCPERLIEEARRKSRT